MDFEWDDAKNRRNVEKHRLSFENAVRVFHDPLHKSVLQGHIDHEERWETIGTIVGLVVVVVITTVRHADGRQVTRLISARRATRRERMAYEEEI